MGGQGGAGGGSAGVGGDGSGAGGSSAGAGGEGTAGDGTAGNGTAGDGTAGDGTAGDGTAGDGTAGDGAGGEGAGAGGSSAGVGGSSAGVGGSSAGVGGSSAGVGGSSAGVGGSSAGVGGSSGTGGVGGVGGVGGSSAGVGGSSAGVGGSSAGTGGGAENTNAACSDKADNDGDGYVDCSDFDCSKNPLVTVCGGTAGAGGAGGAENTNALCSDKIDNDGDGFVDCNDFNCSKNSAVTVCGGTAGAGGAGGAGGTGGGVTLRVANFNVENLLDAFGEGAGPGEPPPTFSEYDQDIDETAAELAMLDADVIALEEIENRSIVLADLADRLEQKRGVAYPTRWLINGHDPVRNIALISTLPVNPADVISHNNDGGHGRFDAFGNLQAGGPYSFARDLLEVTLRHQGYAVTLFVVHYKSKANDDPARRLAEARRTRLLVNARLAADANARVLVLGDFNDVPTSAPLQALTSPAPNLSSGVSLLPPSQAWTHPFGNNQLIDDQLASPSLAAARQAGSITVWHDFDPGFPAALRDVSDHSPVAITYRLGDAPLGP